MATGPGADAGREARPAPRLWQRPRSLRPGARSLAGRHPGPFRADGRPDAARRRPCPRLRTRERPVRAAGRQSRTYACSASSRTRTRITRSAASRPCQRSWLGCTSTAGAVRRLGVAGWGLLDVATAAAVESALPDATRVDVEHAVCGLRARKSAAEIAVIRHAYRLAAAGIDAAVAAIHPGVTESAVAAEAEAAMRRAGAEGTGIDTIVASARTPGASRSGHVPPDSTPRRSGRADGGPPVPGLPRCDRATGVRG